MTERDGDIVMAGIIVGLLFLLACAFTSCMHFPRGPTAPCAVTR